MLVPGKTGGSCGRSVLLELLGNVFVGVVVDFVGSLTTECGVGEMRVVFGYIEFNQAFHCIERVECIEVEPLVFEYSPPGLD